LIVKHAMVMQLGALRQPATLHGLLFGFAPAPADAVAA